MINTVVVARKFEAQAPLAGAVHRRQFPATIIGDENELLSACCPRQTKCTMPWKTLLGRGLGNRSNSFVARLASPHGHGIHLRRLGEYLHAKSRSSCTTLECEEVKRYTVCKNKIAEGHDHACLQPV